MSMYTPFDFKGISDKTVYIKAVNVADLPEDVRASADGLDQIYAVHDADGQQLASADLGAVILGLAIAGAIAFAVSQS